jgi:hypothetical protein
VHEILGGRMSLLHTCACRLVKVDNTGLGNDKRDRVDLANYLPRSPKRRPEFRFQNCCGGT